MLEHWDTDLHCYRAIESVRQYFVNGPGDDAARKQAWVKLRTDLNVTQVWLDQGKKFWAQTVTIPHVFCGRVRHYGCDWAAT